MPLVVPGINSNSGNDQQSWMGKLAGKKIGDKHDETSFNKGDLPQQHRIIGPDDMATMDHNPERLSVHVDKDGTVKDVKYQ